MLAVKGVYKDGKIEFVESLPSGIKEAEVYILCKGGVECKQLET